MRLMVAGTGSGCGKTTVTLALMGALAEKGLSVAPYKAGPDYIDPGFHRAVCGRPSHNLDAHLTDENGIRFLLHNACDISVIEGVMGFYDGSQEAGAPGSSHALAMATQTPVLLVVDASGGAQSVAAQAYGFRNMLAPNAIAAVFLNRVSSRAHYELASAAVARYTGLPCAGYLPKDGQIALGSRHLGLVPAGETRELRPIVRRASGLLSGTADFALLEKLASRAPELPFETPAAPRREGYRLGVALDEAFSFYYQANLDALARAGMELVFFSPLRDGALPQKLDGLYLGGGFPEVFARELSQNAPMRRSVRDALAAGLRCYAECGGMMYLSRRIGESDMAGFLPLDCRMTDRLQRFGYVDVEDRTGLRFPAHEFHYAVAEPTQALDTAFAVRKTARPDQCWRCGFEKRNTLAGFPHLHFLSHPELMGRLWP